MLSRLSGISVTLDNPGLLVGPFLRREALLSSRIEGTVTDLHQLLLFEARPTDPMQQPDESEVRNYVLAVTHGLDYLQHNEFSLHMVREVHHVLMTGARGNERTPGQFRTDLNGIGHRGGALADARYVAPPPYELDGLLRDLELFAKDIKSSDADLLVKLALLHYQFEAIHPFTDGNGRVGRLLITIFLTECGLLPGPMLYLSAYLDENRDEYSDRLLEVSQDGRWGEWIDFFLRGIIAQSGDAIKRSTQLMTLQRRYHEQLQGLSSLRRLIPLVDKLFSWPATTAKLVQEQYGVTHQTATTYIDQLASRSILEEVTGFQRNRIYLAPEIIDIVEAREAIETEDGMTGRLSD